MCFGVALILFHIQLPRAYLVRVGIWVMVNMTFVSSFLYEKCAVKDPDFFTAFEVEEPVTQTCVFGDDHPRPFTSRARSTFSRDG